MIDSTDLYLTFPEPSVANICVKLLSWDMLFKVNPLNNINSSFTVIGEQP